MNKKLKIVFIFYFFSGLLFSWVGLIPGLIFGLRTKDQKQLKLGFLIAGFLLSLVVFPQFRLLPSLFDKSESLIYDNFPELGVVNQSLKGKYPTKEFELGISWNKSVTLGGEDAGSETTKTISVSYHQEESASQEEVVEEIKEIARTACTSLNDRNVVLKVQANKKTMLLGLIPFTSYFSLDGMCSEWLAEDLAL